MLVALLSQLQNDTSTGGVVRVETVSSGGCWRVVAMPCEALVRLHLSAEMGVGRTEAGITYTTFRVPGTRYMVDVYPSSRNS